MADFIPILASIAALIFLAMAFFSHSRLKQNQAVFTDASIRLEAVNKQAKLFEQQVRQAQEAADKFKHQAAQLDKQLDESKAKLAERTVEWNKLKTEREEGAERGQRKQEHLLEQVQVLTSQLTEVIAEKKLVTDDYAKLQRVGDEKTRQQLDVVRQQFREAQQGLEQAKKDKAHAELRFKKAQEEVGLIKPEELTRVQQKNARLEQLYVSMKGLRELAEERNKNWETALRYFAGHVLQKPLDSTLQNQSIGQLVGEALEKIGAHLVIETRAEAEAAEAAATAAAESGPVPPKNPRAPALPHKILAPVQAQP